MSEVKRKYQEVKANLLAACDGDILAEVAADKDVYRPMIKQGRLTVKKMVEELKAKGFNVPERQLCAILGIRKRRKKSEITGENPAGKARKSKKPTAE